MMYFKFVQSVPAFVDLVGPPDDDDDDEMVDRVVDAQHNFILEAQNATYYPLILWNRTDVEKFYVDVEWAKEGIEVGQLPQDQDAYPIEVKVVIVHDVVDEGGAVYYGHNCALYVMNEKGTTLDKLHRDQLKIAKRVEPMSVDVWTPNARSQRAEVQAMIETANDAIEQKAAARADDADGWGEPPREPTDQKPVEGVMTNASVGWAQQ